jgi:hypothetical protein
MRRDAPNASDEIADSLRERAPAPVPAPAMEGACDCPRSRTGSSGPKPLDPTAPLPNLLAACASAEAAIDTADCGTGSDGSAAETGAAAVVDAG